MRATRALTVALAPAALAKPVPPGGGSGESQVCEDLGEFFNGDMKALDQAHASGNQDAINAARNRANTDLAMGWEAGCGWAARGLTDLTAVLTSTSGTVVTRHSA